VNWLILTQKLLSRIIGSVSFASPIQRRRISETVPMAAQVEQLEQRTLLSGGALDPSFGVGGLVMLAPSGAISPQVSDLAVQNDGKIVVVGATWALTTAGDGSRDSVTLWRFNSDGTLDSSFGNQGVVRTRITSGFDAFGWKIRSLPDGKIIVLASTANSYFQGQPTLEEGMFLLRYRSDGNLDPTFAEGGIATVHGDSKNAIYARGLEVQGDGTILVAMTISLAFRPGVSQPGSERVLLQFDPDGKRDSTFGTDGRLVVPQFPMPTGKTIVEQADGKFVMVRSLFREMSGKRPGYDWVVTRVLPDGVLDQTFGMNGAVITDLGSVDDYAYEVEVQADGKILVAGTTRMWDGVLMRLNPDGSLDTSFDSDGLLRHQFHSLGDHAFHLAIQPDGRIIVAGYGSGDKGRVLLARYLAESPNSRIDANEDHPAIQSEGFGRDWVAKGRFDGASVASLIWDGWSSDWTVVSETEPLAKSRTVDGVSTTILGEFTDELSPNLEFPVGLLDQVWSTGLLSWDE
jgi:uncharacterized delta-60 repeat protein